MSTVGEASPDIIRQPSYMSLQELRDRGVEIFGDGVVMRPLRVEDATAYFSFIDFDRDHHLQFHDDTATKYPDVESVVDSIENPIDPYKLRFGIWVDNNLVGSINLAPPNGLELPEVGYQIGKQYTGNGYAAKALAAVTDFGFSTLGYNKIEAIAAEENIASRKTLEKCGYEEEYLSGGYEESTDPDEPSEVYVHYVVKKPAA
jgi:RimJ/RimL family protein N-acetyltransferase